MTRTISTILAATALLATPALAEQHVSDQASGDMSSESQNAGTPAPSLADLPAAFSAEKITGTPVYTTNTYVEDDWDLDFSVEIDTDWNQIGDIEDVVIMPDGEMAGLVVEVGGFLDLGDKHVFIHKDDLQMIDGSNAEEAYFVTRMTADQMRDLPSVETDWSS